MNDDELKQTQAEETPAEIEAEEQWIDDAEAAVEPANDGGSYVRLRRPVFWSGLIAGLLAIVALGAATTWLALDRDSGEENPVVATVNGEPIRRDEYDRTVAQNGGAEALEQLVVERLIESEAKKRNITVDDQAVSTLIDEQRNRFGGAQQFQAALQQAGITEQELAHQFRLNEVIRQMVGDRATVTDQEVEQEYTAAASQFANQNPDDAKKQVRAQLQQEKEQAAAQDLLEQLRGDAKIETFLPGKKS